MSADRQAGFGLGPIPWTAIDRYAGRYGIVGDEFDRFRLLIGAMDAAFLKREAERARQDGKSG